MSWAKIKQSRGSPPAGDEGAFGRRRFLHTLPLAFGGGALALSGCGLPHDPEDTLINVRGGILRVGVSESAPWVSRRDGADAPEGLEPTVLRWLAEELEAEIVWSWGAESDVLRALSEFELDVVACGLHKGSPWSREVAFSRIYLRTRVVIGFAGPPMGKEELKKVATRRDFFIESQLDKLDVDVVFSQEPEREGMPVAAPVHYLRKTGLQESDIVLEETRHVLAVPQGENGWLDRLNRFLLRNEGRIREHLDGEVYA